MNKDLIFPITLLVLFILITFSAFSFLGYLLYGSLTFDEDNSCLIKIAKSYCSTNGLYYNSIYWYMDPGFDCREYYRKSLPFQSFEFTEAEMGRCLG